MVATVIASIPMAKVEDSRTKPSTFDDSDPELSPFDDFEPQVSTFAGSYMVATVIASIPMVVQNVYMGSLLTSVEDIFSGQVTRTPKRAQGTSLIRNCSPTGTALGPSYCWVLGGHCFL